MRKLFLLMFIALSFSVFANAKNEIESVLGATKDYVVAKINAAKVETEPFPHIVIENIFPDDFYNKLQSYWPASKEFVGGTRKILPVTQGCIELTTLPTDQKVFWRSFGEILVHKYIKPNLIKKLQPFLVQKFKMPSDYVLDHSSDFTNYKIDMLTEDKDYAIPAHVDQLNVFAACLIYMPNDDQHSHYGTEFCEGKPSNDPNSLYISKGSYLPTLKKIPYKPNTLVCFLQTPSAWHQVRANNDKNYTRKMFIAPINFSSDFMERMYTGIYARTAADDYFWDHKYLCKKNWTDPWGASDFYK
jgi:hypothetical protein